MSVKATKENIVRTYTVHTIEEMCELIVNLHKNGYFVEAV